MGLHPLTMSVLSMAIWLLGGLLTLGWSAVRTTAGIRFGHATSVFGAFVLSGSSLVEVFSSQSGVLRVHGWNVATTVEFHTTPFASIFTLIVGSLSLVTAVYAVGYLKDVEDQKMIPMLLFETQLFLAAMTGVILSANVFTFLSAWEIMSISSFLLVMFRHARRDIRVAGYIYVAMTHLGTVFITIGFFIIAHFAGSFEFASMRNVMMPALARNLVFLFMFTGFATKAGLVPLHIWLPRAHPVAPSHISALMSGAMIKTAVYGYVLVSFEFLGNPPFWWGCVVAIVGAISALTGIIYSFAQVDQKRVLAYSSIENMGIIFLGLGVSLIFTSFHAPIFSDFALLATLVHLMNHALFKSLLFLTAGSVISQTHTHNLDLMGGLGRRMPWTALFMLIGALSAAAIPPTNGFIGEWMFIHTLLHLAATAMPVSLRILGVLLLGVLVFVGALAAMAFVRLVGMTFLGVPRAHTAEPVREVSGSMLAATGTLATSALILGLFPGMWIALAQKAMLSLNLGQAHEASASVIHGLIPNLTGIRGNHLFIVTLGIAGIILVLQFFLRHTGSRSKVLVTEPWACGGEITPRMTYTASGYGKPIRIAFQKLMRPRRRLLVMADEAQEERFFPQSFTYSARIPARVEQYLFRPSLRFSIRLAGIIRKLQNGRVQTYLGYLFVTLVVVLVFVH